MRDITLRALDTLKYVDVIAAEDTRQSSVLLNHYNIQTPLTRYHDFNKEKVTPVLIERLTADETVAVISDAGTPGISDPAFYLVREAIKRDIHIESVPGATALVSSLVISGLPTDRFVFEGFLPVKKGRQTRLMELSTEPRTICIYESPNRIKRTIADLYEALGDRKAVIARELTKKFEELIRGSLSDLLQQMDQLTLKGEFVILVEGFTREHRRNAKYKGTKYEV